MINYHQRVKQAFNHAAHTYDNHCDVQLRAGDELLQRLKNIIFQPKLAIDLGCGTGLITEQMMSMLAPRFLYAIDIADALLECAEKRLNSYNVKIEQRDFQNFNYNQQFNLVFSNMALHWATSLFDLLQGLRTVLLPDGVIAFTVPLYGTFHELKDFNKHEFYKKNTIEQWLQQCNYQIVCAQAFRISYVFDSIMHALKAIKAVGAHIVPMRNIQGNYQQIKQILNQISTEFELTYYLGIFIGKKRP